MYDYDCCVLIDGGSGFAYSTNTIITETLTGSEDTDLGLNGFFIRDVSPTEKHIIVNRFDTTALQAGCNTFWNANP